MYSTLELDSLASNQISDISSIGVALAQNSCLTKLSLRQNKIGNKGAEILGTALTQNETLLELTLEEDAGDDDGGFGISDEGAKALALGLRQNTSLRFLYLGYNNISDEGVQAFAETLEQRNMHLKTLDLRNNPIEDTGILDLLKDYLGQRR